MEQGGGLKVRTGFLTSERVKLPKPAHALDKPLVQSVITKAAENRADRQRES